MMTPDSQSYQLNFIPLTILIISMEIATLHHNSFYFIETDKKNIWGLLFFCFHSNYFWGCLLGNLQITFRNKFISLIFWITFEFNFHLKRNGQLFYGMHHQLPLVAGACVNVILIARLIFHWPSINWKFIRSFAAFFCTSVSISTIIWSVFCFGRTENNWKILFVHYHIREKEEKKMVDERTPFRLLCMWNSNDTFHFNNLFCIEGKICKHTIGFKYCCSQILPF